MAHTLFHHPRLLGREEYVEDFLAKKLIYFDPLLKKFYNRIRTIWRSASTASSLASTSTKPNYFGRRHKTSTLVVVNKSGPQRGQEVSNDAELNRLSQGFIFLQILDNFKHDQTFFWWFFNDLKFYPFLHIYSLNELNYWIKKVGFCLKVKIIQLCL